VPRRKALDLFGVEMLLRDAEVAAYPCFADIHVEWRDEIPHHALNAFFEQSRVQYRLQGIDVMRSYCRQDFSGQQRRNGGHRLRVDDAAQLMFARRQKLSRAPALVDQTAHDAQPIHVFLRIQAFSRFIAGRQGKSIAPLPHAQRVFRETCFTLDRTDGQQAGAMYVNFHIVQDKSLTAGIMSSRLEERCIFVQDK
jgi:hypothetical protein